MQGIYNVFETSEVCHEQVSHLHSAAHASPSFKFYPSVLLMIKTSQSACEKLNSYCKNLNWISTLFLSIHYNFSANLKDRQWGGGGRGLREGEGTEKMFYLELIKSRDKKSQVEQGWGQKIIRPDVIAERTIAGITVELWTCPIRLRPNETQIDQVWVLLGIFWIQDKKVIKLMRCKIFGGKNGIWDTCNRFPKILSRNFVTFCNWNYQNNTQTI